ncbi:protein deacetylase sirtuin-2 [Seminavis robusta]|uniref:Protein deacetylase sirtuin-2 n=1 Tax=Seminavis robusta TaxID=568900 RepID=A0A9N8E2A1_9STRA|nr:protein deacetylase sirtuin-2 [Seminavis robusta]|eukprot:Sro457_g146870.1 protein deacetylase sirtuin-2 (330) ;mRNA; r:32450-33439
MTPKTNAPLTTPLLLLTLWLVPLSAFLADGSSFSKAHATGLHASLESLAQGLAQHKYENVVVVLGAGVSVNAGIPDFRSPGTGLYSKLEDLQLPYPEAIFELVYFRKNPQPFVNVAQAMWPGQDEGPKPTLAHSFLAVLEQQNVLKRVYTQNIDGLEQMAGVSQERLVECHGHFSSCSCIQCQQSADLQICQDTYQKEGQVMTCPQCGSYVKPDIVFFGEELPSIFLDYVYQDMDDCDLLLVMGTSLLVAPVASIPDWVRPTVPRLLINRELVGSFAQAALLGSNSATTRDVFCKGDCDDGVRAICDLAGEEWANQLKTLHGEVCSSST